ncbi:MAG: hypothetical protein HY897_00040 [Deltaproteobacteria bacterium]|nr:hypothetical protein [Deltaproteobacteria bacterium]
MERDPIVAEMRAVREAFAKEHGCDIKAIIRALKREEARSGRKLVSPPPKRLSPQKELRKTG